MITAKNAGWLTVGFLFFSGCSSMAINAGFDDVRADGRRARAVKIFWNNGTELDKEAAEKLGSLMKRKLTADEAVQIALLNNRELQALYSELGVAQADLVQAGLLRNPIFDAAVMFPISGGGRPDLELSAAMNFLDIFYIPLRKRVAASRFEEVKTRVAGSVLDFAGRVRSAFYSYEADEQMLELRQTIVQALDASFEMARRLRGRKHHRSGFCQGEGTFGGREVSAQIGGGFSPSKPRRTKHLDGVLGITDPMAKRRTLTRRSGAADADRRYRAARTRAKPGSCAGSATNHRGRGSSSGLTRWTTLLPEINAGPRANEREGSWEVGPNSSFPFLYSIKDRHEWPGSGGTAALSAGILCSRRTGARDGSRGARSSRRSP